MQRRNRLWGLAAVVVAAVVLLLTLEVLPAGLVDVLQRAWAALLIFVGLSMLLRNRLPVSGLIAIVVSVALVAGVAAAAYSGRSGQVRDDYREPVSQTIGSGVTLLQVTLELLTTDVELARASGPRTVTGEFAGSRQSQVTVEYNEDRSGLGTLIVRETQPESFPALDAVGRGTLRLELPSDVPLDVLLKISSGDVTANLSGTQIERLNFDMQSGDALVTLPAYEPRSEAGQERVGTLTLQNGDLTMVVPEEVAARLELEITLDPQFDSTSYQYFSRALLENRNFASADIVVIYRLVVPRGIIRVESASAP